MCAPRGPRPTPAAERRHHSASIPSETVSSLVDQVRLADLRQKSRLVTLDTYSARSSHASCNSPGASMPPPRLLPILLSALVLAAAPCPTPTPPAAPSPPPKTAANASPSPAAGAGGVTGPSAQAAASPAVPPPAAAAAPS